MKVKSESEVTQSHLTLCNPMDCSLPGSSIRGVFQARVLEWGAIAFSAMAYYSAIKNKNLAICDNVGGPSRYYAILNKPDKDKYKYDFTCT